MQIFINSTVRFYERSARYHLWCSCFFFLVSLSDLSILSAHDIFPLLLRSWAKLNNTVLSWPSLDSQQSARNENKNCTCVTKYDFVSTLKIFTIFKTNTYVLLREISNTGQELNCNFQFGVHIRYLLIVIVQRFPPYGICVVSDSLIPFIKEYIFWYVRELNETVGSVALLEITLAFTPAGFPAISCRWFCQNAGKWQNYFMCFDHAGAFKFFFFFF